MAIFKCKICGGTLEIDSAQSVATCEYCGTKQTLPKLDDDRRANLYDRANHFRRNNDFDKAKGIYEAILNENSTDAEAYWSIVLCHYGIEYVEDPSSHKRVPTVNRAQYTSIFDDEDYKSALANADSYQREIYEAEANAINEIQKGFLAISQKEEPFDVFICYKETDVSGRRTQDSVLATELYHELTREGFKVFFSRITLEDKLGIAYEPYIFAALNSAKVMVVVGTCPEHFNAVWVKNEWSRYLALIKNAAKKTLIPAYRNMDPYDLPEEFSHLQAQDMSKLGFMQDMIRGIKKIIEADAPKATTTETVNTTNVALHIAPLLKRAFMFLEDGEFDRADEFCEQVLNQDPENAEAYLGKLMVELRVKTPEQLKECELPFDNENYYRKAMRFADATLSKQLRGYISCINERNNLKKLTAAYNGCMLAMKSARSAVDYRDAAAQFNKISAFKDADSLAQLCLAKANEIEEKEKAEAARKAEEKRIADEQERLRRQRQAELDRIEAQKRSERNKKIAKIVLPIVAAIILFVIVLNTLIIPNVKYHNAVSLMNGGKYEEAVSIFEALDGYKDSNEQISNCKYKIALALVDEKKYEGAITILESLVGLENKQQIISVIQAIIQVEDRAFEAAIKTLLAAGVPVELTYQTAGGSLTDTQTLSLGYTLSLDDSILPLSTERSTTSEQTVFTLTQSSNFTGLKTPGRNGYRFVEWELDTYAYDVSSAPASENFGSYKYDNMNGMAFINYEEGIYVGYRYYETRYAGDEEGYRKAVQYPFGHGLSYTDFAWETVSFAVENEMVNWEVKVTNTGDVAGKDVLQLYFTAPYIPGGIEKSAIELAAYDKTQLLQPGESEVLTISFPVRDLSSYDMVNEEAYVLDAGTYEVKLARNVRDIVAVQTVDVAETVVYNTDEVTGTAIENALSSYLEETDLHRDYVHVSDLGRVISSYTWYCTLAGIDHLDEIKLDAIPKQFLKSTQDKTQDRVITEAEKAIILESVNNALKNPLQTVGLQGMRGG